MQERRFNFTSVVLHWVLATSTIFLFISSWWMLALPYNQYRAFPFQLHKNIGITLVILLLVILYFRLRYPPAPIKSNAIKPWMHWLAVIDHVAIYLLLFAVCISGYLSSAYSGWGTTLWWLVELPNWGREDEELNELFSDIHLWTCWILLGFIMLHISGAAYHAFRRDGAIRRMIHL